MSAFGRLQPPGGSKIQSQQLTQSSPSENRLKNPVDARNVDELVACVSSGQAAKYVYFWGHTQRGSEVGKSCLSQWYSSVFKHSNISFPTAEHFMMYRKAELFGDAEISSNILKADSPGEAKALGRKIRAFDETAWREFRWDIAVNGNYAKFSQNEPLREYLLATGSRVLVEASPVDPIWGIGLDYKTAIHRHPSEWKGENLLGFVLMEVRSKLLVGNA